MKTTRLFGGQLNKCLLFLLLAVAVPSAFGQPSAFLVNLSATNQQPARKSTHSGWGVAILEQDGKTLNYHFELDKSFEATSAGIFGPANPGRVSHHQIADMGNGIISNQPALGISIDAGDYTNEFQFVTNASPMTLLLYDGQFMLSTNEASELLAGQFFVNFKSRRFPHGELRGQIWPVNTKHFLATLNGKHLLPVNNSRHQGEAAFTLTGSFLGYQVALDPDFVWSSVGIYNSPILLPKEQNRVCTIDTSYGYPIVDPGFDPFQHIPGYSGQILYSGGLSLSDKQIAQLKLGNLYIRVLTDRFHHQDIGGQITKE